MGKVYFRGLNAFRGFAALLVLVGHVELIKKFNGIGNYFDKGPFLFHLGDLAVTFFFVLSGFLITYLILLEEETKGKFRVGNFYVRRILRIWPLYFFIFILGFLVFPYVNWSSSIIHPPKMEQSCYGLSFILNATLLPNLSPCTNPICFQAWSIGVEEQFYIFWPLLFVLLATTRGRSACFIAIIVVLFTVKGLPIVFKESTWLVQLKLFFGRARFDNMAIGGLFALMQFQKKANQLVKISPWLTGLLGLFIVFEISLPLGLENVLYPFLFAFLILWVTTTTSEHSFLESPLLNTIGKISYGIYMYHIIAIFIAINLTRYLMGLMTTDSRIVLNFLLYILSIFLTLGISYLSYTYFEQQFLKMKDSFSPVQRVQVNENKG